MRSYDRPYSVSKREYAPSGPELSDNMSESNRRLEHLEAIEIARAAVLVGAHSFLVLPVAISLGPLISSAKPRQTAFGIILSSTGFVLAIIQALIGTRVAREFAEIRAALSQEVIGTTGSPNSQQFIRSKASPDRLTTQFLPKLLMFFWACVSCWVLWPW
jgi:hypothetical protein